MDIKTLDKLALLAINTYGTAPTVRPGKAGHLCKHVGGVPKPGYEKSLGKSNHGMVYIQNYAGEYRIDCYESVKDFY